MNKKIPSHLSRLCYVALDLKVIEQAFCQVALVFNDQDARPQPALPVGSSTTNRTVS